VAARRVELDLALIPILRLYQYRGPRLCPCCDADQVGLVVRMGSDDRGRDAVVLGLVEGYRVPTRPQFLAGDEWETPRIELYQARLRASSASQQYEPVARERQGIDGWTAFAAVVEGTVEPVYPRRFVVRYLEKARHGLLEPNYDVVLPSVDGYALAPRGRGNTELDDGGGRLHEVDYPKLQGSS